jgi:thiol-disulfide isomerase/thioredoxin
VTEGFLVLLAVLVVATAFGIVRARKDGLRHGEPAHARHDRAVVTSEQLGQPLGERATLLQFSSSFCGPCRATAAVLERVAAVTPGVVHLDLDVAEHVVLAELLGVRRTPTTLVLDATGGEVTRATGVPTYDDVVHALGQAVQG